MFRRFLCEEDGVTAIEYSLIGVLVLVGAITALDAAGASIKTNIYDIIQAMAESI